MSQRNKPENDTKQEALGVKNLDDKMDKITGRNTRAERQRQEAEDTEQVKAERSFAYDVLQSYSHSSKKASSITIFAFAVIVLLVFALFGQNLYLNEKIERQQKDFTAKYESLNKQYLDYLALYDFSGVDEITVDGKNGTALYQDGQGNVINNGENSSKENPNPNPNE